MPRIARENHTFLSPFSIHKDDKLAKEPFMRFFFSSTKPLSLQRRLNDDNIQSFLTKLQRTNVTLTNRNLIIFVWIKIEC